jgi:hypothetical protein
MSCWCSQFVISGKRAIRRRATTNKHSESICWHRSASCLGLDDAAHGCTYAYGFIGLLEVKDTKPLATQEAGMAVNS